MNGSRQPSSRRSSEKETPLQAMAAQFRMTKEESELVIRIIQGDPSIESLKHPKVLEMIRHRKGRWVKEEEEFADFLGKEFSLGVAPIENGVTRRGYLSSKLACTKMRISKKFKGRNNGKDVFVRKRTRPDGYEFTSRELRHYEQRHIELEKKFIKAALRSVIDTGVKWHAKNAQKKRASVVPSSRTPPIQQPVASVSGTNVLGVQVPVPSSLQTLGMRQHGMGQLSMHSSFAPPMSTQTNASIVSGCPHNIGTQYPHTMVQTSTTAHICSQQSAVPAPLHFPRLKLAAIATMQPTNEPQATQSLGIQLNPMVAAMSVHTPSSVGGQANDLIFSNDYAAPNQGTHEKATYNHPQPSANCSAVPLKHVAANCYYKENTAAGVPATTVVPRKQNIAELASSGGIVIPPFLDFGVDNRYEPIPAGTASHAVSTIASEPSSNGENESVSNNVDSTPPNFSGDTDIPDLLSGFDTLKTLDNRPNPASADLFAGAGGVAESPYITSKSFDELHRLLGKGLYPDMSHLDLDQNETPDMNADVVMRCLIGGAQPQPGASGCRQIAHRSSTSNFSDLSN